MERLTAFGRRLPPWLASWAWNYRLVARPMQLHALVGRAPSNLASTRLNAAELGTVLIFSRALQETVFCAMCWLLLTPSCSEVVLRSHTQDALDRYLSALHSLLQVLSLFGSVIAPFGGFFASGFKRGFKIKDFGNSIPGHGGMTDRMDCQARCDSVWHRPDLICLSVLCF